MIKKLLTTKIKEIHIFSRNEKNQVDSKLLHSDKRIKYIIGDIRDYEAIKEATIGIDYVLHSAAMKHIDKCEQFPLEAKKTNIDGSVNVVMACIENKVKKLVCLSTDKATNPTTIYGNTKMFMEIFTKSIDNKKTAIICTRYGNVLGSNGSVIPLFKELKRQGKPLTITNPNMTRFFMSIEEAVDLVLYALKNGKHKDLFVYNNKSTTIKELADCISSNQIIIGERGIEKKDEALLTVNELNHSELKGKYYRVSDEIDNKGHYEPLTSENCERFDIEELKRIIERL